MARKAKSNNDSIAAEQEEILTQQLSEEVESHIVAHDAHDNYYDNRQMIPADNVDADGVPWVTVGENIRYGNNIDINRNFISKLFGELLGFDVDIIDVNCTIKTGKSITTDNVLVDGGGQGIFLKNSNAICQVFIKDTNISSTSLFPIEIIPEIFAKTFVKLRTDITSNINGTISLVIIARH